jgi:hypothetical protein
MEISNFPSSKLVSLSSECRSVRADELPNIDEGSLMDRVLILDSDPIHAAELESALQGVRSVSVFHERQDVVETVKRQAIDLLVIVPNPPIHWRTDAESIRGAINGLRNPPEVLCILRRPCKGPSDRLHADRLKVKVIYEID